MNGPIESRGGKPPRRWRWPLGREANNRRVRPRARDAVPVELEFERTVRTPGPRLGVRAALALVAAVAASAATAGLLGFGYLRVTRSAHFAVAEVRLGPTVHANPESLRARAGIEPGTNLFAVDLEAATRDVQADPWVVAARLRRELPRTIAIDIVERVPACVLAFSALYLADARGEAFKRALPEEIVDLPVVTGIPRDAYVDDRDNAQALIREGLAVLAVWRELPARPPIGEIHVDPALGVTLYTVSGGGVRVGRGDGPDGAAAVRERLARHDAVVRALTATGERAQLVLVDQPTHPERVTVKLAAR